MNENKELLRWIDLVIILLIAVFALGSGGYYLYLHTQVPLPFTASHETDVTFRCNEKKIEHYDGENWEEFKTSGVVISPLLPSGKEVSKELYLDWFLKISNMNANVVQVQDRMNPDFYEALYDYNTESPQPLYLLQGITLPKSTYDAMGDAVTDKLEEKLSKEGRKIINLVHGKAKGYSMDVSPWVMGYIVGNEWDEKLVVYTNDVKRDYGGFEGRYCSAWETASAFETVLARVLNHLFAYETARFDTQKLMSIKNGVFTDPLNHDGSYSPGLYENLAHVNTQLVSAQGNVKTGIFISYDILPYEPIFLSLESSFIEGKNLKGETDAFYAYLSALNEYHGGRAVMVSSFGLPASRGVWGIDQISGRNGGGIGEKNQAAMLSDLYRDMIDVGLVGGCLAAWQDDWSADTANCQRTRVQDSLGNWRDVQSANQSMGILAVEPGKTTMKSYPDGDYSEWEGVKPLIDEEGIVVQTLCDEGYLYLKIHVPNFSKEEQELVLPIDVLPKIGSYVDETNAVEYDIKADFALVIKGEGGSKLMVNRRYDTYYALHHMEETKNNIYFKSTMPSDSSREFADILQYTRKRIVNSHGSHIAPLTVTAGELHHGNANPNFSDYNSLSDFYIDGQDIEVRIPWALLNIQDPLKGIALADFYPNYGVDFCTVSEIKIGLVQKGKKENHAVKSQPMKFEYLGEEPAYHFRSREAYSAMASAFETAQKQ